MPQPPFQLTAPPVYRPGSAAQPKVISAAQPLPSAGANRTLSAPPVYRPGALKPVQRMMASAVYRPNVAVQAKMAAPTVYQPGGLQAAQGKMAPAVYRPQAPIQGKMAAPAVYRPAVVHAVQRKAAPAVYRASAPIQGKMAAPPVYRPGRMLAVQGKMGPAVYRASAPIQEKMMAPPVYRSGALQAKMASAVPVVRGSAAIQRKIKVNGTWYSFENLYDENGNPFLYGDDNSRMQFSSVQNFVGLKAVKKDDEFITLNEDTKVNVYRNLGYGRPMNLKLENGDKFKFLPFKDYKFKQDTPFDIAVFSVGNKKGDLYPDFYDSMREGIGNLLDQETKEGETHSILEQMDKVKRSMAPVIWAEDYRTPGARKVFESIYTKKRSKIEAELEEYPETRKKLREKGPRERLNAKANLETKEGFRDSQLDILNKDMLDVTSSLPFAGDGGKQKFKKKVKAKIYKDILSEDDRKEIVTTGDWYSISSPFRDSEKEIEMREEKMKSELGIEEWQQLQMKEMSETLGMNFNW